MHKLIILIPPPTDEAEFDERWPEFIQLSGTLPGLRRETTSRITIKMFGSSPLTLIHELYFDTADAVREALNSATGTEAGKTLQRITKGNVTLLLAEHQEDDPAHYAAPPSPKGESDPQTGSLR